MRKVYIGVVLLAFAACAVAVAQQVKPTQEPRYRPVETRALHSHAGGTKPGVLTVPWHVNYQGYLTDDVGSPINDTLGTRFSIWDDASVGTELWNETQLVVVEDGIFSVVLGSLTPIPWDVFELGQSRWLELEVEAQVLSPRTEVTSVAYAYRAVYSDTAEYVTSGVNDSDWTLTGSALHPSGEYGLSMRGSNVLLGDSAFTHVNLGVACTTGYISGNQPYCTVGGGYQNVARSRRSVVGGGEYNVASGGYATVAGGSHNIASGPLTTIGGGEYNEASGEWSGIAAAGYSYATMDYAFIGGGWFNQANGPYATVGGGSGNTIDVHSGTIAGGGGNYVGGRYGAVAGGYCDTVAGEYSFAAGRAVRIDSLADYTFAFGRDFVTSTPNAVVFYNSPDSITVGIQNAAPTHLLDVGESGAHCDGGMWIDGSSRDYKDNIRELDAEEALDALYQMTPVKFYYRFDREEECVGFIAEDVPDLVARRDRKGLAAMDLVAVLTKVVQNQQDAITYQQEIMESQQEQIEFLKKEMQALGVSIQP